MLGKTLCVKQCPLTLYELTTCKTNLDYRTCPRSQSPTKPYLSRYCIPSDKNLSAALLKQVASGDLGRYMTDLSICWWVFLVLGGISAVLGFIYLVLLRWFAKPLIYLSMVSMIGLLIGGGFYVFFLGNRYAEGDNTRQAMHGMGILLWILAALYLIILLCCWSRIQLGAAVIEATSDFVATQPSVFFVPLIFFVIIGIWVVFWVISAVFVYSVGEA